jgi:hypothetical protein
MFDPCFKNMKVIQNYVGNLNVNEIVAKYNAKIVYPIFVTSLILFKPYKGAS